MSSVWNSVYAGAAEISPVNGLRIANLAIAGAAQYAFLRRRTYSWNGKSVRSVTSELAQGDLGKLAGDLKLWDRLAELSLDASHLGMTTDGMHTWAAAYQKESSTQKSLGAYATHNAFAAAMARIAMAPMSSERILRVVDPSAGAGNLLLAAAEQFGRVKRRTNSEMRRLVLSLYGVELDPKARELCCLLLWLYGSKFGVDLKKIAANIVVENALTYDWWSHRDPFDVLLMNPPWESLRHKVDNDPSMEREKTVSRLMTSKPGGHGLPPLYTAQGTGDRNLFKGFVELAPHLIVEGGRMGALLPSAFASDAGLAPLRERYLSQFDIARWTSYENRAGYFPIDGRYKFGLLAATRSNHGTRKLSVRGFAIEPDEVDAPHIALSRSDLTLLGRSYRVIPELSRSVELEILRTQLSKGTSFFSGETLGRITYRREVDLSLDKTSFRQFSAKQMENLGDATFRDRNGRHYVPLLEGRSVGAYDCFQKSWISGSGRTAVWEENGARSLGECQPQYVIPPAGNLPPRVAICDVTASTNTRTVIATLVPENWLCGNTAPTLEFESQTAALAALGILNSMVFDWMARRSISGLHLNKFILEGLVWPSLDEAAVLDVAHAAWSVCSVSPRPGLSGREISASPVPLASGRKGVRRPLKPVAAKALIEAAVAKGFGMKVSHLRSIYDTDRTDRRGFWRYFDANPQALLVAQEALALAT